MRFFATAIISLAALSSRVAAASCDTPGEYICGQALEDIWICSPDKELVQSAICGGNGCCTYVNGVHCKC
ncbi:unnamed protein product [Periconia digitata]|uniref:Uncharacterized protein n=1 Tax=Periconia digitata TaxID=1303443 RepID=A0A9W4UWL8_9PLEO|nr:unnamed protein product [Periconia digitata]